MTAHDSVIEVVVSIVTYSAFSTVMTIVNKLLITNYALDYPMGIIFIQSSSALFFVVFGKAMRWVHYPDLCMKVVRKWFPLTILFVAMLWTSIKSLQTMSVAMHAIMKNFAIVLTAVGDAQLNGTLVTPTVCLSFLLMTVGSCLCAVGDKWVTAWGMFWTALNILATVAHTLYMKQLLGDVGVIIGRYGPVFYNNLLCMFVALVIALPSLGGMIHTIRGTSFPPLLAVAAVGTGPLLTFATFWCAGQTTPTTFSVIGAVNKVPMSVAGMIVFDQFPTPMGYVGISVGLAGGIIYGYASRERHSCKAEHAISTVEFGGREVGRVSQSSALMDAKVALEESV